MRTRRHFQPMLDSMPIRIAPSAVGVLSQVVAPISGAGGTVSHLPAMQARDIDSPDTTTSSPIIITVVTPPTTLPC
jgi:hypothetical protein